MALFNEKHLIAGKEFIVAIDHKYNNNDGAYSEALVWNGEEVRVERYSSGYTNLPFDAAEVDATDAQIDAAAQWWVDTAQETECYFDCEVILQRSRKAPNKTPLMVVGHSEGGFNSHYNHYVPERISVDVDGTEVWVNASCVKQITKGRKPFWANKEEA